MAGFKTAAGGDTAKILRKNKCVGRKRNEPQHAQPQDDIKVLVDPVLRLYGR